MCETICFHILHTIGQLLCFIEKYIILLTLLYIPIRMEVQGSIRVKYTGESHVIRKENLSQALNLLTNIYEKFSRKMF